MTVELAVPAILAGTLALLGLLQIPFLQRKVSRTPYIGVRTRETLADEEVWKEANVVGAKVYLSSLPLSLGLLGLSLVPGLDDGTRFLFQVAVGLGGIFVPALISGAAARRISQEVLLRRQGRPGADRIRAGGGVK